MPYFSLFFTKNRVGNFLGGDVSELQLTLQQLKISWREFHFAIITSISNQFEMVSIVPLSNIVTSPADACDNLSFVIPHISTQMDLFHDSLGSMNLFSNKGSTNAANSKMSASPKNSAVDSLMAFLKPDDESSVGAIPDQSVEMDVSLAASNIRESSVLHEDGVIQSRKYSESQLIWLFSERVKHVYLDEEGMLLIGFCTVLNNEDFIIFLKVGGELPQISICKLQPLKKKMDFVPFQFLSSSELGVISNLASCDGAIFCAYDLENVFLHYFHLVYADPFLFD